MTTRSDTVYCLFQMRTADERERESAGADFIDIETRVCVGEGAEPRATTGAGETGGIFLGDLGAWESSGDFLSTKITWTQIPPHSHTP